ncbi:MAG: hypothetical protein O2817_10010 [Proteobacteria bacterium]|nr:hypothetical protein [Pseudomonadota bacterium]
MTVKRHNVLRMGADIARSKLQENTAKGPPSVHSGDVKYQGIRELQSGDGDCPPLYIVSGISEPLTNSPIPFKTVENVVQAAGFAFLRGFPLVYHLTARLPDGEVESYEFLLRKIGGWQDDNIGQRIFVWARETKNGPHIHILLYIPRKLAPRFRKLARRWLKEAFGLRRLPKGTLRVRRIWSLGSPFKNTRNQVRYILKGADADTRLFLGCGEKQERGFVKGKRAGVSQALGEDARRRAGSVLPSGHRKVTVEMLEAATTRDRQRQEERDSYFSFDEDMQKGPLCF